jgi:hypothetical protein
MRIPVGLLLILSCSLISAHSSPAQKQSVRSPRILSARNIYFDNQTGAAAVGDDALAELKKWGRFQIVTDRKQADLIILLTADPYPQRKLIISGGQTGSIDTTGHVYEDPVPDFNAVSITRYAYLTVIDPANGDKLWAAEHVWGGLLTGFNSVGHRLVKDFEKRYKK